MPLRDELSAAAAPATREPLRAASTPGPLPYRGRLERLLQELEPEQADATMLLLKESRGAWGLMCKAAPGRVLLLANALSGTVTALSLLGHRVHVLDRDEDRLEFARLRAEADSPGRVECTRVTDPARLPFADGSFDLAVCEEGCAGAKPERTLAELARVSRGELVWIAANRLAYKRSTGRRGEFRVPGPLAFARQVLSRATHTRTLAGHRRQLARAGLEARALALYPHAAEFSHVVSLERGGPDLTVGPRERKNRIKLLGKQLGLFPVFTPSYALIGAREPAGSTRLKRILEHVAAELDEAPPEVELLVATRSNNALVHTRPRGGESGGRWTLHVPLSPSKVRLARAHHRVLGEVRERFPDVPAPTPLWSGTIEATFVACETRLAGLSAPHLTGDRAATARMFADAARHMATLALGPPSLLSEEDFELLLGQRFTLVREKCAVESTRRNLERLLDETRERLLGEPLPLCFYHADLRAKHVQVDESGRVLGYLDWGAYEPRFLPYIDLLHLIAHQRKQEEGTGPEPGWRLIRERKGLRQDEHAALEDYAQRIGLSDAARQAIEAIYPVLVAGMAERNWDYSRPRWVHEQFGL